MLTKNQIKLIVSLSQKKFRSQHRLFVVEGLKGIDEFLNSNFKLVHLYSTSTTFDIDATKFTIVSDGDLKKITNLKSHNGTLALFEIPEPVAVDTSKLIVALDAVRDPGNLGTIIRLCDWFGIEHLICSATTVDCFNPKVVQATMGSLTRVSIHYLDLEQFLSQSNTQIFGAFMEGESIYKAELPDKGIVVMGNEANGISPMIEKLTDRKISIPRFGSHQNTESLNVATATAVILSEFKRR